MKTTLISSVVLGSVLATGFAGAVQAAAPINGSVTLQTFGTTTYTGSNLSTASTISLGTPIQTGQGTKDFSSVTAGSLANLSSTNWTVGSTLPSITISSSTIPADRFIFTPSKVTTSSTSANDLVVNYDGIIVDTTGALPNDSASAIFSFTQAGGFGNVVSFSATVTAPSVNVPEPMTTAGGALALGLGMLIRKKVRSTK
jgi:hypothetical protein